MIDQVMPHIWNSIDVQSAEILNVEKLSSVFKKDFVKLEASYKKENFFKELKEMLEPIHENEWLTGKHTDLRGRCCVEGHLNRIMNNSLNDYSKENCYNTYTDSNGRKAFNPYYTIKRYTNAPLRAMGIGGYGLIAVSNGIVPKYDQLNPKRRVLAYIDDAIELGY